MSQTLLSKIKENIKCFIYGDKYYLHDDVVMSDKMAHGKWENELIELANKNHWKVLEIGSRAVVFGSYFRAKMVDAEYVGFDFHPGDNVDVVGDIHKLSTYFEENQKFDLIFSSAVFEHLAMPWIAAEEIAKMLKVGGYVFLETHYSYASHERPWHFFQFSEQALRVLFNKTLGFECVEAGVSSPIVARFSNLSQKYLRKQRITGMYCHSEFLGKKVKDVENFSWEKVDLDDIYNGTQYCLPKKRLGFLEKLCMLFRKHKNNE